MRIFISHGIHRDDATEVAYLDELEARLRGGGLAAGGHDVLLDRTRLTAGDLWEGVLHDWLDECELAILLLGPRGLTRPWVHNEATVLAHRRIRDAEFALYTALLPGATGEDLDRAYPCLRLSQIQAFPAGSQPAAVADWLLGRIAQIRPPRTTPLDELEAHLTAQIKAGDGPMLETICEALTGSPIAWEAATDRVRQRARKIARAIVRDQLGSVRTLEGLVKQLRNSGMTREACGRVLDLAAPRWVNGPAASRLGTHYEQVRSSVGPPTPELAYALKSACKKYTPLMFAWRARLPDPTQYVYWIDGGGSDDWIDEAFRRIVKAYREPSKDLFADDEEAVAALAKLENPIFVVLPPPVPDREMLLELRTRLPRVVFLVLGGNEPLVADQLPDGVHLLHPGLDAQVEIMHHTDYASARTVVRRD